MTNDRELLEQAAKAAGIDCVWNGDTFEYKPRFETHWIAWNPLTDDGDALRLAVTLGLMVDVQNEYVQVFWNGSQRLGLIIKVQLDNEPYAATRRAIVRAAAEIGRTMK